LTHCKQLFIEIEVFYEEQKTLQIQWVKLQNLHDKEVFLRQNMLRLCHKKSMLRRDNDKAVYFIKYYFFKAFSYPDKNWVRFVIPLYFL